MSIGFHRDSVANRFWLSLCWWFTRKPILKPIWRADVVAHDLLGQAEHLRSAGYYAASGMLLRCHLEGVVKRLALITPRWREFRPKDFSSSLKFLLAHDVIDQVTEKQIYDTYAAASKIVHAGPSDNRMSWLLLCQAKVALRKLNEATQIMLTRSLVWEEVAPPKGGESC